MATNSVLFTSLVLFPCIFLYSASAERETTEESYAIDVASLLPSSLCSHSKESRTKSSLRVVHKHGPCSNLNQAKNTELLDHEEILKRDQERVNSIQTKLSKISPSKVQQGGSASLPAKDGSTVGSGNYIVTVGLGTPKKDLSLIFDTGSDITWTQCQPCVRSCYSQKEPIFDPRQSGSYSNISCSSSLCSDLKSATGNPGSCSSSTCVYGIQYGDSSFSAGFFAKERLTLTTSDVFDGFIFGCGENNQGLFGGAAGLLGLGRDKVSMVSQTASAFNKVFSYCLPSSASSTGHLTFGSAGISRSVKFTPLSTIAQGTSFYGLDFIAISVGGYKLSVDKSVFTTAGTIIDSGTVITRLPPRAYAALRDSFRAKMTAYKTAEALSILDTCYDLSGYKTVTIPKIRFSFGGEVDVEIDSKGILYANKLTQVCLAFAGNDDDSSVAIFGNVQQLTLDVVYDSAGGRVGFAPGGCK